MSDAADTARAAQLRAGIKLEGRVALVTGGSPRHRRRDLS
jgi:hypothetical protein